MIAHSFASEAFGPAQKLHGATYVVDAEFMAPQLDHNNIVIDIDKAHKVLAAALQPLKFQNLDEIPQFKGKLTTTEFLAHHIHSEISAAVKTYFTGRLKVELAESHVAWASYEAEV